MLMKATIIITSASRTKLRIRCLLIHNLEGLHKSAMWSSQFICNANNNSYSFFLIQDELILPAYLPASCRNSWKDEEDIQNFAQTETQAPDQTRITEQLSRFGSKAN